MKKNRAGHPCPIPGCLETIQGDHAMCRDHWRMVHPETASLLVYWWRNRVKRPRDEHLRRNHRETLDTAIYQVTAKEKNRLVDSAVR